MSDLFRCSCGFQSDAPGADEDHRVNAHNGELTNASWTSVLRRPDGKPVRCLESGVDADGTPWFRLHPEDAEICSGTNHHPAPRARGRPMSDLTLVIQLDREEDGPTHR